MEKFEKESCVRGYHAGTYWWEAVIGEELECQRERGNAQMPLHFQKFACGAIAWDGTALHEGSGRPHTGFMCRSSTIANSTRGVNTG